MVQASFSYLAEMAEKPVYYLHPPPPGRSWRNTRGDRRRLPVGDARALDRAPSLDEHGFALVPHAAPPARPTDEDEVRAGYYPEMERLVARATGATRVLAFDHNVRSGEGDSQGVRAPVRFVHNDYTEASAPQRVRDLVGGAAAESLLRHRFAVINTWRPLRGPVLEAPLAVLDARTLAPGDLLPTDLVYADRRGEVYSLRFAPAHRWYYFPRMQPDEVLLLKCFDSAPDRARYTAHSAFDDPGTPPDAPPRESIEVRTLAFFAPA